MTEPLKDSPHKEEEEVHLSSYVMLEAAEGRESSNEPVLVGLDTPTRLASEEGARSAWVLVNDAASSVSSQGSSATAEAPQPPTGPARPEPTNQGPSVVAESLAVRAEEQRQRDEQAAQLRAAAEEAERGKTLAEEAAAAERAERSQRRAELERRALEEQRIHQEKLAAEKAARARAQQNEERRRREEEARAFSLRCQRERNNFLTSEDELRRSLAAAEAGDYQAMGARREDARRRALEELRRRVEAEAQEEEDERRAFELSNETIQRMAREIADSEEERERQEVAAAARAAELASRQRLVDRDAEYAATLLPVAPVRLQAPQPLLPEPAVPVRRRCDCLGASSGIHRRDCSLNDA